MKNFLRKTKRAVELATEKGSSNYLTVITLKELDYNQVTVRLGNNGHNHDLRMR